MIRVFRSRGVSVPVCDLRRCMYVGEERCEAMSKVGWAVAERYVSSLAWLRRCEGEWVSSRVDLTRH